MVKQRENWKVIILEPAKSRLKRNECPACGLPKSKWKRRKDWTCCSTKCTEKFQDMYVIYGSADMRDKVLKRDNYTCVKCGDNRKYVEIEFEREGIDMAYYKEKGMDFWKDENIKYKKFIRKETYGNFIADHIIPIALGGDEWDIDNIQTLCQKCNKIKTRQDHKDIAKLRNIERNQEGNQILNFKKYIE